MTLTPDSIIAVAGAGAMGRGIAQIAAQAHHPVILIDSSEEALNRSRQSILGSLDKLLERGKISVGERTRIEGRLRWTHDIAEAATAALVIEAIIENMEAKVGLLARLADITAPDAVLASNTSSFSINGLASMIPNAKRFVGLHFFNPVPVMKLVEIVPSDKTDETITTDLLSLMQNWGKVGVRVRDVPGFIVNRVARPYYAEGFAALGENIEPASIDHVLESAGGFRMGPLLLADMIGHDVNYVVARSVFDAYEARTRFRPQPGQQALFDSGKLGRKSGCGVYEYNKDLPRPSFVKAGELPAMIEVAVKQEEIAPIIMTMRKAGLEIKTDHALPDNSIKTDGFTLAMGDGRTLASRSDIDILLDSARNFETSPIWAITARSAEAAKAAAALMQTAGKQVIAIADRPGQIVLRTFAQLANAAADAVTDAVADANDIDAAMRFGANHPEGPLVWAARTGHGRVAAVLKNIAEASGDPIYAPSEYFLAHEGIDQ